MRISRTILAAVSLIASVGVASAQGWAGIYIGATAGYAFGSAKVGTSTVFSEEGYFDQSSVDQINADGAATMNLSGFIGGATVGWNIGHGGMLFGIEGDYSSMNSSQSRSVTTDYSCCEGESYTLDQHVSTTTLATARVRLGIAKPKTLLYVTGGAAFANMKFTEDFTDTFGAEQSGAQSSNRTGWTAGAGAEEALGTGKWSVKLEYLYADLGTMTFQGGVLTDDDEPFPSSPFTNTVKLTTSIVRLGLNFHF